MRALYGSQLQLTQLLYDFGRTGGAIASNRAAARAARGDEMATRAQVALAALTAYYAVLQAEALAEVADSTLAQQQQRLRQAESFFATGTRAEIDVLIARTAVAQAELQRVQAHNSIVVTRAQLLLALGVTDAGWLTRPLRAEPLPALPAESRPLAELVDEALAQRPDFLALRERVIQAQEQIRVSRGAYFPILQLSATAGINGTAFGSSSSGATSSSGVSTAAPGLGVTGIVGLSWPLFSGMATLYDVRASRARWEVARANLETLRQQVRSQLQQGLLDLRTARQSAVAATVVVKQAEKQLEMASVRYRTGLGNAIELGDAQVTATTARAQRVQSEYALALSRANLQWQLGALHSASGQLP
jgi:outer membrane protein TolC